MSSGKPLTQRRITAILKRATIVGKGSFDGEPVTACAKILRIFDD